MKLFISYAVERPTRLPKLAFKNTVTARINPWSIPLGNIFNMASKKQLTWAGGSASLERSYSNSEAPLLHQFLRCEFWGLKEYSTSKRLGGACR